MMEYELASIIRFVLDVTGGPAPYYWKIPEDFIVPAAYFPTPEVVSGPDTVSTYTFDYAWYIKLFAPTDIMAYDMGVAAATAIRKVRNLIPVISPDGELMKGHFVRVKDPVTKLLDGGACQLMIEWTSHRLYYAPESPEIVIADLRAIIKTSGQK